MIDSVFDIMNGRNPRAKGFKAPFGAFNLLERKAFLSKAREHLLNLVTKDGTPLHRSKRFTKKEHEKLKSSRKLLHEFNETVPVSCSVHRVHKMPHSLYQVHMIQCIFFLFCLPT